ncbi:hypothetical protein [Motilibacter aurantiacus]|uniref:hypothetical protein n=1 Tax=Motilibacter aurantiacus TaxID=2714955 RepID=UPI00140DEBB1|nr:hypothetical protein [Motilibacter aurantiacus]NHC45023.1 hypothetical protein [Motilibacter aurantiacus]
MTTHGQRERLQLAKDRATRARGFTEDARARLDASRERLARSSSDGAPRVTAVDAFLDQQAIDLEVSISAARLRAHERRRPR